jgi:ribosomal protein L11 methyltransferase
MIQGTYIALHLHIEDATFREMVLAELAWLGYDAVEEHEKGLVAHTTPEQLDTHALDDLVKHYSAHTSIYYTTETQQAVNWNELWEKNYQPIEVGAIRIRASFHEADPRFPVELIIHPKMSFGTGHHATTRLMLEFLQANSPANQHVLDVGTGSGILAIAALKLGAASALGLDIDDWVVENASENADLNSVNATFKLGTLSQHKQSITPVGMVLANINRNVLLDEMPIYSDLLLPQGVILLSGFLEEDVPLLKSAMIQHNILPDEVKIDTTRWVAIKGIRK